jgi:protein-disulfide isomerase
MRRFSFAVAACGSLVVGALLLSGCVAEPSSPTTGTVTQAAPIPHGSQGAVDYDAGFFSVGSGPKVVDVYVDPLCPFCKRFEQTYMGVLKDDVASGATTLRIHPLAVLDRLSNGTEYSTRASGALTYVAASDPEKAMPMLEALFAAQPEENTSGLSNQELAAIAAKLGAKLPAEGPPESTLRWVQATTKSATSRPLPTVTKPSGFALRSVPTLVVNGVAFPGNDTGPNGGFLQFYRSQ